MSISNKLVFFEHYYLPFISLKFCYFNHIEFPQCHFIKNLYFDFSKTQIMFLKC